MIFCFELRWQVYLLLRQRPSWAPRTWVLKDRKTMGLFKIAWKASFSFVSGSICSVGIKDRRCHRRGADSSQMLPVCTVVNPSDLTGFMAAQPGVQRNEMAYLRRSTKGLMRATFKSGTRGEVFSKGLFWDNALLNRPGWPWLWGFSWFYLLQAGVTACNTTLQFGGQFVKGIMYKGAGRIWETTKS